MDEFDDSLPQECDPKDFFKVWTAGVESLCVYARGEGQTCAVAPPLW